MTVARRDPHWSRRAPPSEGLARTEGEPLDLRLDIKISPQTNQYKIRLRVTCSYGNLMMAEVDRISKLIDNDARFATFVFEVQNNGIEIYDAMPSAA